MNFKNISKFLIATMLLSSYNQALAAGCCSGHSSPVEKDKPEGLLGDVRLEKDNLVVKPFGEFEFQYGHRMQRDLPKDSSLTNNQKSFAFFTRAKVGIEAKATLENNISYGAKIALWPFTKTKTNNSYIFVTSDMGEIQLGSGRSVDASMKVDAYDVGPGGYNWIRYAYLNVDKDRKIDYFTSDTPVLDDYIGPDDAVENSRKITYKSPDYRGFSFGVSYAPDTQTTGAEGLRTKRTVPHPEKYAFALALNYKHQVNEDLDFKLSLTGTTAKAVPELVNGEPNPTKTKHDVKTFTLGGLVNISNFTLGGSYSDWGKSLEFKKVDPTKDPKNHLKTKRSYYYTAGVGYKTGPVAISLIYLNGNRQGNKLQAFTIGSDYKVAPGFTPFFEITRFEANGKSIDAKADTVKATEQKRKGTILVLGTRIFF